MSLKTIFAGLASSVPSRVLAALGMGFVTFSAYTVLMNELISAMQTTYGSMTGDMLAYAALGGFKTGIGILLGSAVTSFAVTSLPKLSKLAGAA